MNVALIMERIETWRGGAETSTIQFANHLAGLGCNVSVLTTSHSPSTPTLTVVPIKTNRALRAGKTWLFARRAAAYLRRHPFDIVHSITPCVVADVYQPRGGTVPETLERNLAMRSGTLRRVLKRSSQSITLKYRVVARLERQLLTRRPAPWVIAISDYVSRQLAHHYRFDSGRVRLIFNGVDPDPTPPQERREQRTKIRRQFGLADDDLILLAVAHNFRLKGVVQLIEAVAQLDAGVRGHTYAVIVGRDNPSAYVRLARQLGIADRVLFAGPTQRVQAFFHAADVFVHPTFYDPCSRVVLEALAAGLPVITTRFNGAAERITNGVQGYVIDSPRELPALVDGIHRLADDAHRRECARRAPQAVEEISMKRHAAEVLKLYEEIIGRGKGPRSRGR